VIKLLGNLVLLLVLYSVMLVRDPGARTAENHGLLAQRIGLAGIASLGAGALIITGGIDLSMGSVVALVATALGMLLTEKAKMLAGGDAIDTFLTDYLGIGPFCSSTLAVFMGDQGVYPAIAIPLVLLLGAAIGLVHGLLVTYVRLQAFIVTLCGLFIYRGLARWLARDSTVGLGTSFRDIKQFFNGDLASVPVHFLILLVLVVLVGILLHFSVHGRYAFALGSNENAARYCGVRTNVYKVLAYVLCSTLTAGYGVLLLFKSNAVQPNTTGNFLELYAIAAAVIGGCSLRGGDGNVVGIFLGTCIITVLPTLVLFMGIPSTLEYAIIGGALLLGALVDEMLRRYYAARKA
jgi:ribose transport system permease protein